ncbi:N-acetylmuramoyl-L-alanine amidase [Vallitalea okinawensis]|uniref:N-acetylmuramoyl-L-alanine amidase n=1 Tax=Vallitalea okinawensis TaxID=2078660 RepID=UPI000CFC9A4C|nr:N-acetylmuramoyl-L-alanine amidase [Vallitalea okinawensis]
MQYRKIIIVFILFTFFTTLSNAQDKNSILETTIHNLVRDQVLTTSLRDGETFISTDELIDLLEGDITFDSTSQEVYILCKNTFILLSIDESFAYVNGTYTAMDAPTQLEVIDDKTHIMTPINFMLDALQIRDLSDEPMFEVPLHPTLSEDIMSEQTTEDVIDVQLPLTDEEEIDGNKNYEYIIVIDPGHGGNDPGKPNDGENYAGMDEKVANLNLALIVNELLSQHDEIKVYMTRTDDTYPTLKERCNLANEMEADLFISIHHNSFAPIVNGTETYYYDPENETLVTLANIMQKNVTAYAGTKDRGLRNESKYVLSHTDMPALLIEVAYMSSPIDGQLIQAPEYKIHSSLGIYNGILEILETLK